MKTIAHTAVDEKQKNLTVELLKPEDAAILEREGLKVKFRPNKVNLFGHEKDVVCAAVTDLSTGNSVVILPAWLSPHRIYPIFVYLFAAAAYLCGGRKSFRKAAAMTRKRFGLATFSHTTLMRALKVLVTIEPALEAADAEDSGEALPGSAGDAARQALASCAAASSGAAPGRPGSAAARSADESACAGAHPASFLSKLARKWAEWINNPAARHNPLQMDSFIKFCAALSIKYLKKFTRLIL